MAFVSLLIVSILFTSVSSEKNFSTPRDRFQEIVSRASQTRIQERTFFSDDLPYCIEGSSCHCRVCNGTPYRYTRTYQYGNPIRLIGCCTKGVIYQGVCHPNAFLDKKGNLCKTPYGLDPFGKCVLKHPFLFIMNSFINGVLTVTIFLFVCTTGYLFLSRFIQKFF